VNSFPKKRFSTQEQNPF